MSNHSDFHSNSEASAETIDSRFLHDIFHGRLAKIQADSKNTAKPILEQERPKYEPVLRTVYHKVRATANRLIGTILMRFLINTGD
jgi:hypothetical protein